MLLVAPERPAAIENIRRASAEGRFNDSVEPLDPVLDPEELKADILRYVARLDSPVFTVKNFLARLIVDGWMHRFSEGIDEIIGLEKLSGLQGPAFVTASHFNPFDSGILRTLSRLSGRDRLVAVSQGANFRMPGLNGFVLRNIDVIPLLGEPSYMNGPFRDLLQRHLDKGRFILIYPEQSMWFNYRKPRPGKRGAYLFAAQHRLPVIPTFAQLQEYGGESAPGFGNVRVVLHVLDPLYPDPSRTDRENSFVLCRQDYEARVACYERCYGKPLDYSFTPWDIAGWRGNTDSFPICRKK